MQNISIKIVENRIISKDAIMTLIGLLFLLFGLLLILAVLAIDVWMTDKTAWIIKILNIDEVDFYKCSNLEELFLLLNQCYNQQKWLLMNRFLKSVLKDSAGAAYEIPAHIKKDLAAALQDNECTWKVTRNRVFSFVSTFPFITRETLCGSIKISVYEKSIPYFFNFANQRVYPIHLENPKSVHFIDEFWDFQSVRDFLDNIRYANIPPQYY